MTIKDDKKELEEQILGLLVAFEEKHDANIHQEVSYFKTYSLFGLPVQTSVYIKVWV